MTIERMSAAIRETGLRATRPRVALLDVLARVDGHHSAEDLHEILTGEGTRFPITSVYNALAALVGAGLVMRADAGPGVSLYEHASEWHHHLVCRRCGGVFDTPCVVGSKPCLETLVPGADVDEAQVIFRGVCAGCRS